MIISVSDLNLNRKNIKTNVVRVILSDPITSLSLLGPRAPTLINPYVREKWNSAERFRNQKQH